MLRSCVAVAASAAFLVLSLGRTPAVAGPPSSFERIVVDGATRTFRVHVGHGSSSLKPPLVIVFHGHGGTAAGIEGTTDFDGEADAHGFIAVYPNSADNVATYSGGPQRFNHAAYMLPATVSDARWAQLDGCTATSTANLSDADGSGLPGVRYRHTGCNGGVEVLFDKVIGGPHKWQPGSAALMWAFFTHYHL